MKLAKPIWAGLSIALAFVLNGQLRPQFEAAYERSQQLVPEGALALLDPALEIETLAAHVVVADAAHFGKVYRVRELSLRSLHARGAAPSFELFAGLPDSLGAEAGRQLDPSALLQLELAVQPTGRLGARTSFVQRGAGKPEPVLTGSCQFTDIHEVWDTGQAELHAEARLELQVEHASGVELLTAKWSGRLLTQ